MNTSILHLTVVRQLSAGQEKQLLCEYEAAEALEGCSWTTIAYHDGNSSGSFIRTIPLIFRGQFRRKLFAWLVALRLGKKYSCLLMRHITFDPFSILFAPLIRNRCSVHHAKEVEELRLIRGGLRGIGASLLESVTAKFSVYHTRAIFGVTLEIANYERHRYSPLKPVCRYPNGISLNAISLLGDRRRTDAVNVAFICGTFNPWHGLDKILKACLATEKSSDLLTVHLIGRLSAEQTSIFSAAEYFNVRFVMHGHMSDKEYKPVLEECDYGIASLALSRQGLAEGSTLKVREMLALGLPVYSGHNDIALPADSNHVMITQEPSIEEMIAFGWHCKGISREEVRKQSIPLIDKSAAMKDVVFFLRGLENSTQ